MDTLSLEEFSERQEAWAKHVAEPLLDCAQRLFPNAKGWVFRRDPWNDVHMLEVSSDEPLTWNDDVCAEFATVAETERIRVKDLSKAKDGKNLCIYFYFEDPR